MSRRGDGVAETVVLANRITAWLQRIDADTTGAGVDFADSVAAGKKAEELLLQLVALDTSDPAQVRQAQDILGELHAWLLGELRPHLDHLEQVWETLEDALYLRAPDPDDAIDESD